MARSTTCTWLRASDAADLLGVSRSTVHHWIVEGTIDRRFLLKTGSRYRIARVFCEGRHLLPVAAPQPYTSQVPIAFPSLTYSVQAQA